MLTSIRIQNFRSIRDASVKLGQVNLFIGPNNSGKSNFLKGIEWAANSIELLPRRNSKPEKEFEALVNRGTLATFPEVIVFTIGFNFKQEESSGKFSLAQASQKTEGAWLQATEMDGLSETIFQGRSITSTENAYNASVVVLREYLKEVRIYKPEPLKIEFISPINSGEELRTDCSNIVSFLYNLREDNRKAYQKLENDFRHCIGTLETVSMPPNPNAAGTFRLRFADKNSVHYWAEEVSEGVLYFLALLCIIHQPDPPKLLLLEEPEKGIHPRRIKEVMDFILELAHLRDIQIIITSHSPYVVDHFADIPECISVFDREDGETIVRNAGDIINETNAELVSKGHKPISYTDSLGEYWVSGFLGGVPV